MVEITIENETFKTDSYSCSPILVRLGDSLQTLDGTDHSEGMKIKRHLVVSFKDISREDMARLLSACLKNNISVTYFDSISNQIETRIFKLQNDPTVPMKIWKSNLQYYEQTSIELKEKGASLI